MRRLIPLAAGLVLVGLVSVPAQPLSVPAPFGSARSESSVVTVGTSASAARQLGAVGSGAHVVAVGDIAQPGSPHARVAALTTSLRPDRLLLAGDIAYPDGSLAQLRSTFDPAWGRFGSIWLPVPGNHEYRTRKAAGYRTYFGESGGLWWSRKIGSWRVIGLDSERVSSKKQQAFLKRTLKKYNRTPTLVVWHRPRYSSGHHGDQRNTAALYNLVRKDRDVKLIVWGHDHDYERMTPPVKGRASTLTAFVVGSGGGEQRVDTTRTNRSWSRSFTNTDYGVLDLRLRTRSFSWAFVTIEGRTLDAGTQRW